MRGLYYRVLCFLGVFFCFIFIVLIVYFVSFILFLDLHDYFLCFFINCIGENLLDVKLYCHFRLLSDLLRFRATKHLLAYLLQSLRLAVDISICCDLT